MSNKLHDSCTCRVHFSILSYIRNWLWICLSMENLDAWMVIFLNKNILGDLSFKENLDEVVWSEANFSNTLLEDKLTGSWRIFRVSANPSLKKVFYINVFQKFKLLYQDYLFNFFFCPFFMFLYLFVCPQIREIMFELSNSSSEILTNVSAVQEKFIRFNSSHNVSIGSFSRWEFYQEKY